MRDTIGMWVSLVVPATTTKNFVPVTVDVGKNVFNGHAFTVVYARAFVSSSAARVPAM